MSELKSISTQPKVAPAAAAVESLPSQKPFEPYLYKESLQGMSIQRKLAIGAVDDPLEQEADAMADKVMRMPEPNFIQRKCSHCEEEEKVQRKSLTETITPFIQTKGGNGRIASDAVTNQIATTKGSGSNMDSNTKSFMESRFGANFSGVNIHTGDYAVQMSKELNAQAFTVGKDIYFNSGKYAPDSYNGKHLLAHELTHTVQQNSSILTKQGKKTIIQREEENSHQAQVESSNFESADEELDESDQIEQSADVITGKLMRRTNTNFIQRICDHCEEEVQLKPLTGSVLPFIQAKDSNDMVQPNEDILMKQNTQATIQREEEDRHGEPVFELTDEQLDEMDEGSKVELIGIVQTEDGANLWPEPGRKQPKLGFLEQNTRVFVDRKLPGDWYSVYVEGHQREKSLGVPIGTHGYIAAYSINTDMPDPDSWLYRIQSKGQGALAIAVEIYKGIFTPSWGKDYRYLVNVLVAVNEAKGRKFLFKENPNDAFDAAKALGEGQIWVPGIKLVDAMHGQVSSGSISYEIISTLGDVFIGTGGFIVGLLEGAVASIADIFIGIYDLATMAIDIFKKLIKGTLLDDAKFFFRDILKINIADIIDMVGAKWNHPDTWERWKFRGYVIGYAIMEIVLLIFSGGIASAIKWAGKVSKIGKLAEYLTKLPRIVKFIEAAKTLKGAQIEKIKLALKAAEALSEVHGWAAKTLRIPMHILLRLSEIDIGTLKKLPQYLREKFAHLSERAMLRVLGCNSPCKVDLRQIENALKLTAKTGTKLDNPNDVLKMLKSLPEGINVKKISAKLRKQSSALMTAIKKAELTNNDFLELSKFLTPADLANPATGYQTFVRYLTSVVPAKTGKDINKLNKIAAELIEVEVRRGAAMKGAMFEQWVAMHIPELSSSTFKRITFDLRNYTRRIVPPYTRPVDKWLPDKGAVWEMKHQFSKVPADQIQDYTLLLGKKAPDGNIVERINYLFPTKAAAEINRHIAKSNMWVWYIDEITNKLTKLK